MVHREELTIETRGRATYEITRGVQQAVTRSGIRSRLCNVFIKHTSASLIICENADPTVRRDLEHFAARLVPDGDPDSFTTPKAPTTCPRTSGRSSPSRP